MDTTEETGCYCGTSTSDSGTLMCEKCSQSYHIGCLKYGGLSPLQGDIFFTLICARCSDTGEEIHTRMKLSWQQVVTLVLYNLHLSTAGMQGYFHWKQHICASIVKHWVTLFGNDRSDCVFCDFQWLSVIVFVVTVAVIVFAVTAAVIVFAMTAAVIVFSVTVAVIVFAMTAAVIVFAMTAAVIVFSVTVAVIVFAVTAAVTVFAVTAAVIVFAMTVAVSVFAVTAAVIVFAVTVAVIVFAMTAAVIVFAVTAAVIVFAVTVAVIVFAVTVAVTVFAVTAAVTVFAVTAAVIVFAMTVAVSVFAVTAAVIVFAVTVAVIVFAMTAAVIVFAVTAAVIVFAVTAAVIVFAMTAAVIVFAMTAAVIEFAVTAAVIEFAMTVAVIEFAVTAAVIEFAMTAAVIVFAMTAAVIVFAVTVAVIVFAMTVAVIVKKTATWCGTVAGTLSSGCPRYFRSGTNILKESGWWALAQIVPPSHDTATKSRPSKRQRKDVSPGEPPVKVEGLRKRVQKSSIAAAIALRAKRDMTQDIREIKKSRAASSSSSVDSRLQRPSGTMAVDTTSHLQQTTTAQEVTGRSVPIAGGSTADRQWLTERELMAGDGVPEFLLKDDDESDFEIDPCTLSSPTGAEEDDGDGLPQMAEILAPLKGSPLSEEGLNLNMIGRKIRSVKAG
ncbi:hypothetical protein NP493_221g01028 [Ridgeia piscesae]|uniref:Zinc finger PHD-type domain-containing protein n=1 Tax=Ridgeia piscesae TaxID=27915 RepID=A0AAD9P0D7_RIDPI|nr:hypothetical protein NP493_221g01028 [Ridgeia piscesae]